MRHYSLWAKDSDKHLLEQLLEPSDSDTYRKIMEKVGHVLAKELLHHLGGLNRILLVCTNEDADFLARGILSFLEATDGLSVSFACFWNDRKRVGPDFEVAPIIRRYIEPHQQTVDVFIVIKSIISSSCVVRSNISELVYENSPQLVFVVSPVVLAGATQRLEAEFDSQIAERFRYIWIAEDDQSNHDGRVIPGIGGSIYELLGIGTSSTKNQYIPKIVKERRMKFHIAR